VNTASGAALNETSLFFTNDSNVYSWLSYSNVPPTTHNITWAWFTPQNALYYNATYIVPNTGNSGETWSYLAISGNPPASKLGVWQVNIFVDGAKSVVQTFTINATSSFPKQRFSGTDSAISTAFNSSSVTPINRTLAISVSNTAVYSWVNFTYVPSPSHNVTFVWVTPQKTTYFNTSVTIPDPGAGKFWYAYTAYDNIFVNGHNAAQMTGVWEVDIYVDGTKILIQTFTIH
jgi:hypothetical protein